MIHNIRIAKRETEEFALKQPDILRVHVKTGVTLVDRLDTVYTYKAMERMVD